MTYEVAEPDRLDMATVYVGNWDVYRNHKSLASAVTNAGCTVQQLADDIGFNADELQEWLTPPGHYENGNWVISTIQLLDGSSISFDSLQPMHVLAGNQYFAIPNIIYSVFCGDEGQNAIWQQRNQEMRDLGFSFWVHDNDSYGIGWSAGTVQQQMAAMLQNNAYSTKSRDIFWLRLNYLVDKKYLHGIAIMGHGDSRGTFFGTTQGTYDDRANGIMSGPNGINPGVLGPKVKFKYSDIEAVLNYKLATVIVHACHSGVPSSGALSLVSDSPSSIFRGHDDLATIHDIWPIDEIWNPKGIQRTNG